MTSQQTASFQLPQLITIAADTEFSGAHTLSIQAVCRSRDGVAIQVYKSPLIPFPTPEFDLNTYLSPATESYGRFYDRAMIRPLKVMTRELSPTRMLRDLVALDFQVLSRVEGKDLIDTFGSRQHPLPSNVTRMNRFDQWIVPYITIRNVVHFQPADFYRLYGRDFFDGLLNPFIRDRGEIAIHDGKRLKFVECRATVDFSDPVVEYIRMDDGRLFEIRLATADTMLPFGPGSLNEHCQTFLGLSKSEAATQADKENMRRAFHEKPDAMYGYAITDAVNTLLVDEQMCEQHRAMYSQLNFPSEQIPPLRGTLGARVSDVIKKVGMRHLSGSDRIKSERSLKSLMLLGSRQPFKDGTAQSQFGEQVTYVHGGLLFSRSPTKFWHEAPGMLRDVDLGGCYNKIVSRLNVYWGRPIVYEPGRHQWNLRSAIVYVREHAPADGWMIRVTGNIATINNVLIPSTRDALTSANYNRRTARRKARQATIRGFELDYLRELPISDDDLGAKLFSGRIESGVVTWATWLMIQALPPNVRMEYETLTAESIVFYPSSLIADTGQDYDRLCCQLGTEELPWDSVVNLDSREIIRREHLGADYVSMRFPVQDLARVVGELRDQAQAREGKGSGADKSWKLLANSMFGVLATSHLDTGNFVAANQVTATARAIAFGMMLSLNGFQVITDGCTYRRDQIPNGTFEECLRQQNDYPLLRAEATSQISFCQESTIPSKNDEFTDWFRGHVKHFFNVEGEDYDRLFGLHCLEHKMAGAPRSASFDALAVDGSGNYLKCSIKPEGGWNVDDMAARSYRRASKDVLKDWIVRTYSTDCLTEPPPITEDIELLKIKPARDKARKALTSGIEEVFMPLGMPHRKVMNYKLIKASSFIFDNPAQHDAFIRAVTKFENDTECGLEVLALRRTYGNRRKGSLVDLAAEIYRRIQSGDHDFMASLNLNREFEELKRIKEERPIEILRRKNESETELFESINTSQLLLDATIVGYFVKESAVIEAVLRRPQAAGSETFTGWQTGPAEV